MSLSLDSHC